MFDLFCCMKAKSKINKESKYFKTITLRLNNNEISMLELIYNDLAERDPDTLINQENFLMFFNLNGLWGQKLFHEFDQDRSQKLQKEEFINGISKFVKATDEERIRTLFSTFEMSSYGGITYYEFVKMLYNYPKQELKHILNDPEFYEVAIKGHAKRVDEHSQGSRCMNMREDSSDSFSHVENPQKTQQEIKVRTMEEDQPKKKSQFHKAYQHFKEYKDAGTSLNFDVGNKKVEVRSANINNLVKRFAAHIYERYGVDRRTGKINEEQFRDWISKHPRLYNSYFEGFHNYVWQYDKDQPKYVQRAPEKASDAKIQSGKQTRFKSVYMMLLHTTIIICQSSTKLKALHVICLQGLAVNPFTNDGHLGIQIKHRDGIYPEKRIIFANADIQKEWLEALKSFQGQSIQQKYSFFERIGTGRFSTVYRAIDTKTKAEVAIKVMQTYKLNPDEKNQIAHETSIMKLLNHPNVIKLHDTLQTKTHLYIVTQLAKGADLFDYVQQNEYLRQYDSAYIIGQIIVAVMYLNSLGLVHRDLKPENIMVIFKQDNQEEVDKIKVIDFGFANYVQVLEKDKNKDLVGTPNYMAPETLTTGSYGFKVDNFAIGVILFFMLRGLLPFDSEFRKDISDNTIKCVYDLDDLHWKAISNEAKDLIRKLLVADPKERLEFKEALNHPWFRKVDKNEKKIAIRPFLF